MDRSWMYEASRLSDEYTTGVEEFIGVAMEDMANKGSALMSCPCRDCNNGKKFSHPNQVRNHLIRRGFKQGYKCWIWHGESLPTDIGTGSEHQEYHTGGDDGNDLRGLETDIGTRTEHQEYHTEENDDMVVDKCDNFDQMLRDLEEDFDNDKQYCLFENLYEDSNKELYPGCSKFSKLKGVLKLYNLKASNGWSDRSFTELLQTLKEMLPDGNEIPPNVYEAKKILCPVDLEVQRIHACPNDCILYRNEYKDLHECPKCGASRYKPKQLTGDKSDDSKPNKGPPAKALWYLPVKPRFKRLFSNAKDAKLVRWHADNRKKDGKLRHPADSPQWRNIDREFPEFGRDPRNLKLGLSADGINPHSSMSSKHSSWPVLLCIYNLPPWLCMKRKYIMMTLLISGPKQPGNDIDVYLAPLIDDLKELWQPGVQIFDAYSKEKFTLRAMIFCTINDFPAYGNLSGYSVKGEKACPVCLDDTVDLWLPNSSKNVYMGHRRFLPTNHALRKRKIEFNGKTENTRVKYPLTGKAIYSQVKDIKVQFGKFKKKVVRKKGAPKISWKKRSIFWDLPYWQHLEVRHCLDVMHVVKNVCDSMVGTLLNIPGKTKDGINARKDMQFLNIRPDLQPAEKEREKGKFCTYLEPAMHTLSKEEKKSLCGCLHGVKVPSGYSSNIKNLVSMEDLKLTGMKSHDCHVLMTQLLPVAIRGILPPPVRQTITKLCFFFNAICCKVTDPDTLDALQKEVVVTLCHLEMYFPPSFFDIMVHLTVHLIREIKMCGPVFLRYMYPFERFMGLLKGYVRNRYRPEGSIVRAYAAEEVIEFCTNYLDDVKAIGIPKSRHEGRLHGVGTIGGKLFVPDDKTMSLAHFHVLQHLTDVYPFWDEHMTLLRQQNPKKSDKWLIGEHNSKFQEWFTRRVMQATDGENIKEIVKLLALGPVHVVRTFQGYDINGYTFYTRNQDSKSTVQNSGVTLVAVSSDLSDPRGAGPSHASMSYYGFIEEIWELDYRKFNIPLFMCKWVDNRRGVKVDGDGFILVDFSKAGYKDDPFILARQATQVFYVTDPADRSRHVVLSGKRRIIGIDNVEDEEAYDHFDEIPPFSTGMTSLPTGEDNKTSHTRNDHDEGEWIEEVPTGNNP